MSAGNGSGSGWGSVGGAPPGCGSAAEGVAVMIVETPTETRYQRVAREQRERQAARETRRKAALKAARKPRKASTRHSREADRIDGYDRNDIGLSPDF